MGAPAEVDVLMVTHRRAAYTRQSLTALLASADAHTRVWIWQNEGDDETWATVQELAGHPAVHEVHRSPVNERLWVPVNWLWTRSTGALVGKVDDDCVVATDWIDRLRRAHAASADLGVVCAWHFAEEDFDEAIAAPKLRDVGGVTILENFWVAGSGYLMKRACIERHGHLRDDLTFHAYCVRLAVAGWRNGFLYPLVLQDHLDDPRSPRTGIRTTDDLRANIPLSAWSLGIDTIEAWEDALRRDARHVLQASTDRRDYVGWRKTLRRVRDRISTRPSADRRKAI